MKKINFKKGFILLTVFVQMLSCTKFEDLADDPNKATSVPPSLLMSQVLKTLSDDASPWSEAQRDNQFWVISFDYYGDQDYNWGAMGYDRYKTLSNILAMEKEAGKSESYSDNGYGALAKFLKAYFYDYMTKRVGDIPFSESLKGNNETEITQPKYDSQKDVYTNILDLLEAANDQIAIAITEGGNVFGGDFYFDGKLEQWQRVINAFHLRVLISLSKKNSEMDIAGKINTIVSNPSKYPLLRGLDDNMKRTFGNETGNRYTWNPGNFGANRNRNIIGATYLNLLKDNNDPRIYIVADPAAKFFNENDPLNLDAYIGANTGDEQGQMQADSDDGKYSYPSELRYYSTLEGEPYIRIGYSEQEFIIAEAINRGWVSGDAETHYLNGIKASMAFYGVAQADIDTFLLNSSVAYKGDNTNGLNQILTQKYIAFFNNSGMEAYFNYRRTGVPTFDIGPANKNNGRIPKRWKYPQSEFENNTANINAALGSQYGGSDDINAEMWLIK